MLSKDADEAAQSHSLNGIPPLQHDVLKRIWLNSMLSHSLNGIPPLQPTLASSLQASAIGVSQPKRHPAPATGQPAGVGGLRPQVSQPKRHPAPATMYHCLMILMMSLTA